MSTEQQLPFVIEAGGTGTDDLGAWASANQCTVQDLLTFHGAILLRGFKVATPKDFRDAFVPLAGEPIEYVEQSSPRSHVAAEVYTSTEYPAEREILLHNEQSYNSRFPRYIAFFCRSPAARGGETPIADTRRVLVHIPPVLRDQLQASDYSYVRNFGSRLQMSWQQAFGTEDAADFERYCQQNEVEFEWLDSRGGRRVRTLQKRRVIARHPVCRDLVWFNHFAFFHFSSVDEDLRQLLKGICGPDNLPYSTYLGDGTIVSDADVALIRDAYRAQEVLFSWQAKDVLLVDNMLVSHGRKSFVGGRSVLVAMSTLCNWSDVAS